MCEAADRGPGRDSAMDKVHGKNRRGRRKQVWIRRPAEESSESDSDSGSDSDDRPALPSVAEIRAAYQREQAAANDAAPTPAPSDGAEESSSSDSDSDDDYDPMA